MGASASTEADDPSYWHLRTRAERRFASNGYPAESGGSTDVVQTADKYDFLLVFKDPESMIKKQDDEAGDESVFSPLINLASGAAAVVAGEGEGLHAVDGVADDEQISCRRARTIWRLATPGPDTVKDAAEVSFNKAWKAKFHKPWDEVSGPAMDKESVPFFAVRTLFRELVCAVLSSQAGLQLKLSRGVGLNSDFIMCRIRAPIAVLEQEADRIDYRLQFRDEVDPGKEFWFQGYNNEEIKNEALDLDRAEAEKRLQALYDSHKITANDMSVFDSEPKEHAALWSRRVHTLERVADMVPCRNEFPAFGAFSVDPKRRHVFKQHQSVRGKTLFQSKDRLCLTNSIISQAVTVRELLKQSLLADFIALHDANLGEVLSNEVLTKRWVFPWKESRRKMGAPTVSSRYMNPKKSVPLLLYPFSQPLHDIRAYFGEKVAFYYAWLGFLTLYLVFPAVLGLALQIYLFVTGFTWCDKVVDWFQVAASVAVVVWCTVVSEMWKGEEAVLATKWGTDDKGAGSDKPDAKRDKFAAQQIGGRGADEWFIFGFKNPFGFAEGLYYELSLSLGYKAHHQHVVVEDYRRDPVTNRFEPFYPEWLRTFWVSVSAGICVVCAAAVFAMVEAFMVLENTLASSLGVVASEYVTSACLAVAVATVAALQNRIAAALTDNENHPTDTQHNAHLVVKVFLLNVAVYFGPLVYIAFVKESTYGCANDCCMDACSIQLVAILAVTVGLKLLGPVWKLLKLDQRLSKLAGLLSKCFFKCVVCVVNCFATCVCGTCGYMPKDFFLSGQASAMGADSSLSGGDGGGSSAMPWEQELSKDVYEGVFSDMSEALLLLSLVCSFFSVFPAGLLFLVLMNLLEIRMDAYKMMHRTRRPIPEAVSGMGMWSDVMDLVAVMAAFTNSAVIVFTTNTFEDEASPVKFLIWLTATASLLILRGVLMAQIPDEPFGLDDERKRHEFLRRKHVFGFMEDEDEEGEDDRVRGVVDLESMDLSKMVGAQGGENAELVDQIRNYQTQLRMVNNELEESKTALQDAMLYEIMNNKTGIGETLDGLPLGCLYITLEKIESFVPEPLPFAGNIQMVISLRSSDDRSSAAGAPGPPPVTSKRGRPTKTKGEIEFEELFTLAPIKTHKADIFFDIMDSSTDPKRRGTAYLNLSKLSDQLVHQKAIFISQRDPDNATRFNPSEAKLKVKVQFKYSKIKPVKERIAKLTKSQATIEKAITMARLGRQKSDVA